MPRLLACVSAATLLAVTGSAQCLGLSSPGTLIGTGDDTTFAGHHALGFSFPVAGSALGTYTHFVLNPNGWIILTDGTNTPAGSPTGYGSAAILAGSAAGNAPRIVPFWEDMNVVAPGGVYHDNTTNAGVSCTITFKETREYNALPTKSYQVELFAATGDIKFTYSPGMNVTNGGNDAFVGVSRGNGQVLSAASVISGGVSTAGVGMVWQHFPTGTFDLGTAAVLFHPDGSGGWDATNLGVCTQLPASNTSVGQGCYSGARGTFYQHWPSAAAAAAVLPGNSMMLVPTANGYAAVWTPGGAASYVAPSGGATSLTTTDDGATTITPSVGLTLPGGGSAPQLMVSHNGIITVGSAANNPFDYTPTGPEVASATGAAFYSWNDYNDTEVGSGTIKTEEVVYPGPETVLYVTWDNVESWQSPAVPSPSTFQFQLNLTTGVVNVVWVSMDTIGSPGRQYLVGYTDAGVSMDPGSIDLPTKLPLVTQPDLVGLLPLTLSAAPAPVSTLSTGTTVTYTVTNIPEFVPLSGVYLAVVFSSFVPLTPVGVDLDTFPTDIGAPGCSAYIGNLLGPVTVNLSPLTSPTQTGTFFWPASLPYGLTLTVQAISLITPFSLPNGQNAFGIETSNAVTQFVSSF